MTRESHSQFANSPTMQHKRPNPPIRIIDYTNLIGTPRPYDPVLAAKITEIAIQHGTAIHKLYEDLFIQVGPDPNVIPQAGPLTEP